MEDVKCPRCGKTLQQHDNRHYLFCAKVFGGCGSMWAKSLDCYYTGIYVINSLGEITHYKRASHERKTPQSRKVVKTSKLLPEHWGWEMDS